jgi:hypothetical protein
LWFRLVSAYFSAAATGEFTGWQLIMRMLGKVHAHVWLLLVCQHADHAHNVYCFADHMQQLGARFGPWPALQLPQWD